MKSKMKSSEQGRTNSEYGLPEYPVNFVAVVGRVLAGVQEGAVSLQVCAELVSRALEESSRPPLADGRLVDDALEILALAGYVSVEWRIGRVALNRSELTADFAA